MKYICGQGADDAYQLARERCAWGKKQMAGMMTDIQKSRGNRTGGCTA